MKRYIVVDSSDAHPCLRQLWEIWEENGEEWNFIEEFEAEEEEQAHARAYELNQQEGNNTI
jgi:hypothetical protein